MSPEQKLVLDSSTAKVNPISIRKMAITSAIYIPVVLLVFYLLEITFTVWNVLMVVGVVFAYAFIKEFILSKRAKKILAKQYAYMLKKHPQLSFYVPLLDVTKNRTFLKLSALFFENDELFLEAYKQKLFSYTPVDSITIPYGKDFVIKKRRSVTALNLVEYQGTLVDYDYHFFTFNQESVNQMIDEHIQSEKGNKYANSPQ